MKIGLLLALVLTGCAQKLELNKEFSVVPDLLPYVQEFEIESKNQGRPLKIDNLIVIFADDFEEGVVGDCVDYERGQFNPPTVRINRRDWPFETEIEKTVIMFHELGHCVLWRDHEERWTFDNGEGIVKSIMHPYIQDGSMYFNHWPYYMRELFYGI